MYKNLLLLIQRISHDPPIQAITGLISRLAIRRNELIQSALSAIHLPTISLFPLRDRPHSISVRSGHLACFPLIVEIRKQPRLFEFRTFYTLRYLVIHPVENVFCSCDLPNIRHSLRPIIIPEYWTHLRVRPAAPCLIRSKGWDRSWTDHRAFYRYNSDNPSSILALQH